MNIRNNIKKCFGLLRFSMVRALLLNKLMVSGKKNYIGRGCSFRAEDNGKIYVKGKLYVADRGTIGAYNGGELHIGNNNFFNKNLTLICYKRIVIGDNNLFGPNIVIVDHNHNYDKTTVPICDQGFINKEVSIGSDCWIAANVTICPGSCIGDHIIVAANSLVKGELNKPGVYGGMPAKLLKER